ncbi:MAG TPA: oligosaccharide flippase family protein [Myxococcota bacterium]|nr:oligosaccharide flippase family protein [Myxococcota bacterium]
MGFFRNAASVFATSAIALPISVVTNVVVARWLSVPDRGLYAELTNFSFVFYLLTQLGWGDAVIYRVRGHGVPPRRAFATGLFANGAVALGAFALCVAFREPLSHQFLGGASPKAFWLAAATGPLLVLGDLLRGVARALDRFDLHNQFGLLQSAAILGGLLIALPLAGGALEAALSSWCLVQVFLVAYFGARVAALAGFEWRLDLHEAAASIAFGGAMYFQYLLIQLHERADVLLLGALGTPSFDVALYATAVSVISPLRLVPGAIGTALLPELSGVSAREAAEFTAAVVRTSALVMLAIALGLAAVGALAIPLLFGARYAPAVTPFLILLPGLTAVTVSRLLQRYFAAVGRPRALWGIGALALGANVGLNLVLIPRAGILGAATAGLCSTTLEAVATVWYFSSESGQRVRDTLLMRGADFARIRSRLR